MQKIAGDGATHDGRFQAADAALGHVATEITAPWLNAVQDEIVNVVEGAGITLNTADNAQLVAAIRRMQSTVGRRNYIINGAFEIAQRSAITSTSTDVFCADRWRMQVSGTAGFSANASSFIGITPVDSPTPQTRGKLALSNLEAGSGLRRILQRIEDVRTLAGQTCTLSFWAQLHGGATVTAIDVVPSFRQHHGAGGAADQIYALPTLTLVKPPSAPPGAWFRYKATITLPTHGVIGGGQGFPRIDDTVAPPVVDAAHYLELRLDFENASSGAAHSVVVAEVQLEAGEVATDYDYRPLAEELLLCQRYFEKSWDPFTWVQIFALNPHYSGASRGRAVGTRAHSLSTRFQALKARVPDIHWYSPQTGAVDNVRWGSSDVAVTQTNDPWLNSTGDPQVGSSQSEAPVFGHWTAEAEL